MRWIILALIILVACSPVYENPQDYCNDAEVYICEDYVKVVSTLPNKGISYYKDNQKMVCPFSAIEKMGEECQNLFTSYCNEQNICEPSQNEIIGGERDSFGCLKGYSFDNEVNACIRELDSSQRSASKMAVDYIGWKKGLTITEVQQTDCQGCFFVIFDDNGKSSQVRIENWQAISTLNLT